ncbi:hypothetical protein QFC20_006610 [Naganishia adeliensis]|uniref:Uncharacterized protein n=1 Tax=Naganishia adeliensis TaxID=92952 RepID=A0ACC2V8W8_9TREE|nr:hypothetical protein QFC20_006610 [Naganishia adeliensis]
MASGTGTLTVTQTHTVTAEAFRTQATPEHAGYTTGDAPPPPPYARDAYPAPPLPPQPGFPFDPYMVPHQVPPPMLIPLAGAGNYQAGVVMDPFTAVLSIIIVAGMYWAFKNGGIGGMMAKLTGAMLGPSPPEPEGGDDPKKSSSSKSGSKDEKE